MLRHTLALAAVSVCLAACNAELTDPVPAASSAANAPMSLNVKGSQFLHRVSVGGPDALGPGVDKNFSMVAMQRADGSVSGQFTDQWKDGRGSIHVTVDCLQVVGNRAWVSGVVTGGTAEDMGAFILTMVEDNGTSAKDPPDAIAGSYYTDGTITCQDAPDLPLLPMPKGQVKVQ